MLLKHGRDGLRSMASHDKICSTAEPSRKLRLQPLISGVLLAAISMACALGASNDPIFTPPAEPVVSLSTEETASLPFFAPTPTDGVIVDPTSTPEDFTPTQTPVNLTPYLYTTIAGDTIKAVAVRFGVDPAEIISPDINPIPETSLLAPNTYLIIPNRLGNTTSSQRLIPDSEIVFSPSAINFDIQAFANEAGGYLSTYQEYLKSTGNTSGADIIARVARDNSINPHLLLGLLEYQSGWVYGQPGNLALKEYPMGIIDLSKRGLYTQLTWAVKEIMIGYYGWREGLLTDLYFPDGVSARFAPDLNAGTVALQYFFSRNYDTNGWVQALDLVDGFPALYTRMFGDPWVRALTVEPLYPPDLEQPPLILPFYVNQLWSYTGGPHGAWEHEGALAAIDFAPGSLESGCVESDAWIVAAAPGLVVRSERGIVVIDLDGDGYDQTGWALLYLHVATKHRILKGTQVETGDRIGHPSCEGGQATGTHLHFARKYNGEWIAADGPIPFNLSGWIAHAGKAPYEGTLTRDGETVKSSVFSAFESRITREREEP